MVGSDVMRDQKRFVRRPDCRAPQVRAVLVNERQAAPAGFLKDGARRAIFVWGLAPAPMANERALCISNDDGEFLSTDFALLVSAII